MKCPSCGRENVEGSSFCSVCANPILISRIWSSNPHDHSGFSNPAGTSREVAAQLNRRRVLLVVLVVIVVIAPVVAYSIIQEFGDRTPVVQEVDGGIMWTLDFNYRSWNSSDIWLYDGPSSAYWTLEDAELDQGMKVAYTTSQTPLGEDNVTLTVVDSKGNGIADHGDTITIIMLGSSFRSDRDYQVFLKDERSMSWSGWDLRMKFIDGHLDSYSISSGMGL